MMRRSLFVFFLLPLLSASDSEVIQLQSIQITSKEDLTKEIGCSNFGDILFCEKKVNTQCVGTANNASFLLHIIKDNSASVSIPKIITWSLTFKEDGKWTSTPNGTLPSLEKDNDVTTSEAQDLVLDTTDRKATPIINSSESVTVTFTYMKIKTKTEVVKKNTQAVVVAVLEGLLLGAILIVFVYRECFVKQKQRATGSFGGPPVGGNVGMPSGTPSTGATGGNYYDNAAVAYRQNNVNRNDSYGYDQPAIRLEDRTRAAESTRAPDTQARVQTDSPSLVTVPLGADPLQQWGDNPNGVSPDRLFS